LSRVNRSWENVVCLIGDNTSTNLSIADKLKIPFIVCYSHRLNLAIKQYLKEYEEKINKIDGLMKVLKMKKIKGKLLKFHCRYEPQRKNATRWGSELKMLISFQNILPYLEGNNWGHNSQIQPFLDELGDLESLVNGSEDVLIESLKELETISLGLQSEDTRLHLARFTFESLIESMKYDIMRHHLSKDYVTKPLSKNFESAIIKIQRREEHLMNDAERESVFKLLKEEGTDSQRELNFDNELTFESIKKRAKIGSHETISNYIDCSFIEPTSNIAERLFSRVRKVWTEDRKRMLPSTLEVVMILKYNKQLWDVDTITKARKNPRKSEIIVELNDHDESARTRIFQEILENDEKEIPNHFMRSFEDEISDVSDISDEVSNQSEDSENEI